MNLLRRFYRALMQFRATMMDDNGQLGIFLEISNSGDTEGETVSLMEASSCLRTYTGLKTISLTFPDLDIFIVNVERNGWINISLVTESNSYVIPLFNVGRPFVQPKTLEKFGETITATLVWTPSNGTLGVITKTTFEDQKIGFVLISSN